MPLFCADRHKKPAFYARTPPRPPLQTGEFLHFSCTAGAARIRYSPFSAQESLRYMVFIHNFAEIRRFAAQQRDNEAIKKQ